MDEQSLIIDMLKNIEERLSNVEKLVASIIEKNKTVEKDCSKMREHIDFIENTYSLVRTPLSFLKTKIEYVMGKENTNDLPSIEYKQKDID